MPTRPGDLEVVTISPAAPASASATSCSGLYPSVRMEQTQNGFERQTGRSLGQYLSMTYSWPFPMFIQMRWSSLVVYLSLSNMGSTKLGGFASVEPSLIIKINVNATSTHPIGKGSSLRVASATYT